jgi:hypothetical protein
MHAALRRAPDISRGIYSAIHRRSGKNHFAESAMTPGLFQKEEWEVT